MKSFAWQKIVMLQCEAIDLVNYCRTVTIVSLKTERLILTL